MKTGKLSESMLKRSVLRQIKNHRIEVIKGAGVGEDCAFLMLQKADREGKETEEIVPKDGTWSENMFAVSVETVTLPVRNGAYLAVMAAANNLAASGAEAVAVMLSVTLPAEAEEEQLKELMGEAERCCRELNIQIAGGHTEVSSGVKYPVITATVTGRAAGKRKEPVGAETGKKSLDIVMSKWIGMEGTSILAVERERELLGRYPVKLIEQAKEQGRLLSVAAEAGTALAHGVYAMHDIRNGGIFGALWELSSKTGFGIDVDLKKISVRQETIEVCEFFGLNPYELLSGGALLMLTEDGAGLVNALAEGKISSAVIGSANTGNDKIIRNGEEIRYLGHPAQDEIFRIL